MNSLREYYLFNETKILRFFEKGLLTIVAMLTIIATFQELISIFKAQNVQLADLLLLFIYAEVLGMIGAFLKSNKIPITLPLFIAMTALARLIILQGKEMEAITLLYEAGAILILALACLAIRFRPSNSRFDEEQ